MNIIMTQLKEFVSLLYMGNIPSAPPQPRPVPVPVPIPINDIKKNYRRFKDFSGKHAEKIINEYLIL
jgi:hypothetical protein